MGRGEEGKDKNSYHGAWIGILAAERIRPALDLHIRGRRTSGGHVVQVDKTENAINAAPCSASQPTDTSSKRKRPDHLQEQETQKQPQRRETRALVPGHPAKAGRK